MAYGPVRAKDVGALFAAEFKILPQSDRMGIRLGGAKLTRIGGAKVRPASRDTVNAMSRRFPGYT